MSRKPVQTLVAFTAALLLAPLASLQAADPPSLAGSFLLGVYWPWERSDGLAKRRRGALAGVERRRGRGAGVLLVRLPAAACLLVAL